MTFTHNGTTVELVKEDESCYVYYSNGNGPDVLITRFDEYTWECWLHKPENGEAIEHKKCYSIEGAVAWAQHKGAFDERLPST